ncbi:sigma-70 family RNA polymerase sigma factor [Microbacterium marinilacus]|uniref:RNA polymerase sigma factor FliA n=1 Tax=Microbacterium marinilacus TaxID=415209 RepID=A0ABP7B660_9MICO|nr:sigma-70 family RNA polymerase sigma factor [Microbacterium marinilacus]MBY0687741.1 sigma-70 family RNA polymerase sigma factor [Microbacterium marinilacus]
MTRVERNRLVVENLPLVGFLAAELSSRATHISREDLAAAGALALVTAADAFDPTMGVPFGAYARRRILGAFADEMRAMDWASRGIRRRIKETTAVRDTLTAALGRTPTTDEIASTMGVDAQTVTDALADAERTVIALDDPIVHAVSSDLPLPDAAAAQGERREVLQHALEALPERMRLIVRAVYVEERPVKEIAAELGVSHSAVSQQRAEGLRLLRDALDRYDAENPGDSPAPTSRVSDAAREAYFTRIAANGGRRLAGAFLKGAAAL